MKLLNHSIKKSCVSGLPWFSPSTFIPIVVLISALLLSASERCFGATYYASPNGNDRNNGSLSSPWRVIRTSIAKLRPGDTLYLRGGTYFENRINITVSGNASRKITISNYSNEVPVIDGGYREFRRNSNLDWEVYDSAKGIYRSVRTYPNAGSVEGYFASDNDGYRLVTYADYNDLCSDNENFVLSGSIYIGPGLFWNSSDARIYIRLKPSSQEISMGYNIPSNTDPRSVAMYIFPCYSGIIVVTGISYIDIKGIQLRYQGRAIEFQRGSHHISATNSNFVCGKTAIMIREGAHDLLFDRVNMYDNVPPWITWSDAKIATAPGRAFAGTGINIQPSSYNIEVMNCLFQNTWDGIDVSDSYGLRIHHNTFLGTRDDVVQLGSACYNVEINHNKMLLVSKGISRHGSGASLSPGTKYMHHNIIDCSRSMLGGRNDPNNLLDRKYHGPNGDRMVWARPFGSHEGDGCGTGDPWKVYNNTLIFGKELNNRGAGHEYGLSSFYPGIPQEVYNNIIIQTMDHYLAREVVVSDGSQICDGNIYYRKVTNPQTCFFRAWISSSGEEDFASLSEFKLSQFAADSKGCYSPGFEIAGIETDPQLDSNYYPASNSPAASGAVLLPVGWPGQDSGVYRGALPPRAL